MSGIMCAVAGGGGGSVILTDLTVSASAASPSNASAAISLGTDGQMSRTINASSVDIPGQWWNVAPQAGVGSLYEARFTETSGTVSSGTTGSYLAISTIRSWSVTRSTLGTKTCTGTLEIRRIGTATVLAAATITMSAEQTS
jgi:hypothetical protein